MVPTSLQLAYCPTGSSGVVSQMSGTSSISLSTKFLDRKESFVTIRLGVDWSKEETIPLTRPSSVLFKPGRPKVVFNV